MVTRAFLLGGSLLALLGTGACALVLGFEDHEPFPEPAGGSAGAAASGGLGGQGGTGGQAGASGGQGGVGAVGGSGGEGGEGGAGTVAVLLIPDAAENSVGMYDPSDGHYLGDFIPPYAGTEPYELLTPHSAVQGPDGLIYLSDQLADAIYRFAGDASFVDLFADASDGLDNVRGIDFRDDELFVSVSPGSVAPFVARFDLNGNRQADFVADSSDPFDVHFLPNGTMLLANIEAPSDVRLYDVNGGSYDALFAIDFPQQLQSLSNGNHLAAGWVQAQEFGIDGTIIRTVAGLDAASGIWGLDSGNWLIVSDDGVQVVNPFSQQVVATQRVGMAFMKIERAQLPPKTLEDALLDR